jgi:hypothetical protein
MFIWQASVALSNLMDPPVVDSTERLNTADTDPLLITVCPLGQWNKTKLAQFGYKFEIDLLTGMNTYANKNVFIGWGAQQNLTFEELVEKLQNSKLVDSFWVANRNGKTVVVNYESKFYSKFGYCYELVDFTTSGEVILEIFHSYEEAQVYITDKKLRTRNDLHVASHWGSKVIFQRGWQHEYVVKIEKVSNFDPRNPDDCKVYNHDDFENCVDAELQKVFKPLINCNPPWLSSKDQCDSVMNVSLETVYKFHKQPIETTLSGINNMKTYPARESCKKPCIFLQANVLMYEKTKYFGAKITLTFADQVVFTTKKLAYGPSAFLIDMGSNLGLWFGLSVFGITDLGILALQWVMNRKQAVMRMLLN